MSEPQPGDFFLAQIQGWAGFAVRVLQRLNGDGSRWTHAGILLPDGKVFEAEPGGAVVSLLGGYQGRPLRWSSGIVELTDQERKDIVQIATSLVGVGYGWDTYLYLALYRLGIRLLWIRRLVMNRRDMMCSQAVDEVYNRAEVHLFNDGRMPQDVTPGDLARLLDHPDGYAQFC